MTESISFWKDFIYLQMKNNFAKMLEDSIKNFHYEGFNYVCFQFSPHLTLRLYILYPQDKIDDSIIQTHNHLYDSLLLNICGEITNNTFRKRIGGMYNYYHLTSALNSADGKIVLERLGLCQLEPTGKSVLMPGMYHKQLHDEIHHVENDKSQFTSWMIFEFATLKKNSILFSKQDLGATIQTPGCYQRYEEKELRHLVNDLLSVI